MTSITRLLATLIFALLSLMIPEILGTDSRLQAQVIASPIPQGSTSNPPATSRQESSGGQMLFKSQSGEMIPLEELLGKDVVNELLQRAYEQRSVPRYTIDRLELTGKIDRDEVQLTLELQVKVEPASEWVAIPISPGDVSVTQFSSSTTAIDGRALLTSGEQNVRQWLLYGKGTHTLRMEFVGKSRTISPGVSQLVLALPQSTSSHAVFQFSAPVELQKIPLGAVPKTRRDEQDPQGIREAEFWLANNFSMTWSEVVARVAQKPVIQSQTRMKLDLTTIPATLSGTQTLQVSGSPTSELQVQFPDGFRLLEADVRNASGASVIKPLRIPPTSGEPLTLPIALTSAMEGTLVLSFELELTNRQFPQDIRVSSPAVREANFQPGDLDLLFPTGLLVQQTELKDAQRIRVTSEADLSVAATAFRMRSPESQVVLHVEETDAQFAVSPEMTLKPDAQNVIMTVKYPISVLKGSLLDLSLDWPGWSSGEWQLVPRSLRLTKDTSSVPLSIQPSESEQDLLQLTFPERQSGEFEVEFQAFASLPAVRSGTVQLRCPELRSRSGQPFVLTTIESDQYSILPISMGTGEQLPIIPLATTADTLPKTSGLKSESWLHDDPAIPVRLELREQAPSVRAEITMGLIPKENGIEIQESIRFEIEHRDLASLSLQVPDRLQPIVRISGQTEPLRASIESSKWSFRLPETRRGALTVEISYLWPIPLDSSADSQLVYQVPVILPQSAEIRSVVAGTRALSGLVVKEESGWQPVFSEKFELAWATSRPAATVPLQWQDRRPYALSQSPDLILVRTQIIGGYAITSNVVVCETTPDFLVIETPVGLEVEEILAGSTSLTSASSTGRERIRQKLLPDKSTVRWQIATRSPSQNAGDPLILTVRVREQLTKPSAFWDQRQFHRVIVAGESSATPILWFFGSQDEFQVTSSSEEFSCLTHRSSSILPGGETVRTLADRQIQAVLSSYPNFLRTSLLPLTDDWLDQSGRQDVFFGSAQSAHLQLTMLPGVSLLLVSAGVCVLLFLLMSVLRQIPLTLPALFVVCASLVAWLVWPEWAFVLAPYVSVGVLIGVIAMALQRYMADRRIRFPGTSRAEELPTVFGFTGMLAPPMDDVDGLSLHVPSQAELSSGSAR